MANAILENIKALIKKEIWKAVGPATIQQGFIDSAYTSGNPKVVFLGETTPGDKTYPYLAGYTPVANDRVLLARVGKTYIIIGKIS